MIYGAENGLFPHITCNFIHIIINNNNIVNVNIVNFIYLFLIASWITHREMNSIHTNPNNKKDNSKWKSLFPRKYLNSGTFLGRAKEVK